MINFFYENRGIYSLFSFAIYLLHLSLVFWAYKDAISRGKTGWKIAAIVLFGGPIGLVYWLSARPPKL
ncbi:hypothetical protein HYG86_12150 [Alkalicella caledoniensis]|uniref:Cardiolipin synthase N-terminal domain-containing protein n=1 Tax=Alkalicella caledoniensis TaxID=2731377 RepID=A0A7G9W9V2_ALKCA|nr:hypothetical protein [Alkalicella caledoniensis]QNO15464.1 hypothetical protein HYG86_12150 [Alkalicella caledoniensis]